MKALKTKLGEKEIILALTAEAKFQIDELCGESSIVDATKEDTKEALETTIKATAILVEQAELARRYMGYTPTEIPTEDEIRKTVSLAMTAGDVRALKVDLYEAVLLGHNREIESKDKEVDLVLQELEKKTKN